jgi:hypothetical protein
MEPYRLYAWILLAVPKEGEQLSYVLSMVDGLNRTLPDPNELRDALGWLHAAGLIAIESERYRRSDRGRALLADSQVEGENAFQLWDRLTGVLEGLSVGDVQPLPLSEHDLTEAYEAYNRR